MLGSNFESFDLKKELFIDNFKLILIIFIRFVFGALIEFAVVNYVSRQDSDKKRRRINALNASVLAARAREDSELGVRTGIGANQNSFSSTRAHRRHRAANRSSRKKFESGKDSGIESDDLEDVIATRYVKSLGATKLSAQTNKNQPTLNAQENVPLTSVHRDSASGFSVDGTDTNLPPPAQYANTNSPSTSFKKQPQMLIHQNQQLNNRQSFSSNQPVYRGPLNRSAVDDDENDNNGQTNFVNLVVNSQAKTNAVGTKKSRNFFMNWLHRFPTRSKRIDVLSRIFFPLLFALFNVFYWVTYLFRDYDVKI